MTATAISAIRFLAHAVTLYRVWDRYKSAGPVVVPQHTECEVRERRDGKAFVRVKTDAAVAYGWVPEADLAWAPF